MKAKIKAINEKMRNNLKKFVGDVAMYYKIILECRL